MKTVMMSPQEVAARFGCSVEKAREAMRRNARSVRRMTNAQLRHWGKTADQAEEVARAYEEAAL